MADVAADPGRRGELIIRNRALSRIVEHVVLEVSGVVRTGARRRDLPRAVVDASLPEPNILVDVALAWPGPVARQCREIRGRIDSEVTRLTGRRPSRIDVTVSTLVPRATDDDDNDDRPNGGDR
ncbi:MAG TPA: hypothetical protein VIW24_16280 [Aldersonia sp.]